MPRYTFKKELAVNTSLETMWAFLSNPKNLKKLTPTKIGGEYIGDVVDKMEEGMTVSYKITLIPGWKITWKAQFIKVNEFDFFVDEQINGPFRFWRHKHSVKRLSNGVLLIDEITYEPPFGVLGALANRLFIRRTLKKVFQYRSEQLKTQFGLLS